MSWIKFFLNFGALSLLLSSSGFSGEVTPVITIGSKAFTEGYILGELLAQKLEDLEEVRIERKFGLGGTGILYQALTNNKIQLYAEYTGTIAEAILKNPKLKSVEEISAELDNRGFVMSQSLGFNNTYALAVQRELSDKHDLKKISDLARVAKDLRLGFSHEFMTRADGYSALKKRYQLPFGDQVQSMEHSLAYEAIESGGVDLIDVYSTDAKIEKLGLVVLEDDLKYFPRYEAVILARKDFVEHFPDVWKELKGLEGKISEVDMRKLNASVDIDKKSPSVAVKAYLGQGEGQARDAGIWKRIWRRTKEHLVLIGISLSISILIGVPLGVLSVQSAWLGQMILLLSGVVQTIPSLALLCFLVPVFGIGVIPALVALCLYGLLPVVTGTFIGIRSIDPQLKDVSRMLRLGYWNTLVRVELPLASPSIIAGIRTSAVIGIGTATLAALIGAGGYGAPIVAGLAMNDTQTILLGAIPSAVMALFAHGLFEVLGRFLVPRAIQR